MWLGCGRTGEGCTRDYSKGCGGRGTGGSLEARGQSRGREGCGTYDGMYKYFSYELECWTVQGRTYHAMDQSMDFR